ncbi:MAG: hypothetical protein VXX24_03825 [Pseudomonadota bacterium]|nr:hypothetical protein [Pseudomonadota bacterium]
MLYFAVTVDLATVTPSLTETARILAEFRDSVLTNCIAFVFACPNDSPPE